VWIQSCGKTAFAAGLAAVLAGAQSPASQSNLIWVTANVIHGDGHLVTNLTAADFEIEDNGQPPEIAAFRNDRIPMAVAIMVDVSRSLESNYSLIRRAVGTPATRTRAEPSATARPPNSRGASGGTTGRRSGTAPRAASTPSPATVKRRGVASNGRARTRSPCA
jgi:hypothetical protein